MTLKIRPTVEEDALCLKEWLKEPGILEYFPMCDANEVEDSTQYWVFFAKHGATLTAEIDGVPVGMAILYVNFTKKIAHQALFAIVVDKTKRGQGIGTKLLEEIESLAKNRFHIEVLHLEVYETNPARGLYERLGFKEYGEHPRFLKENGKYATKVLMQKELGRVK